MKNSHKYWQTCFFIFLTITSSSLVRGQNIEFPEKHSFLGSDKYSVIVATVGDIDITAREFLLNYEFGSAFLKREKNSKEKYLNLMIYEKLLALDGYAIGMGNSLNVLESLREIEGDLITEELYRDDVMNNVIVSEEEIEDGIQKNRKNITLMWLFNKTKKETINQKNMLDGGASFDSLFINQINDSVTVDDRTLEITRFRLQIKNTALSIVVDSMKVGEISDPIEVQQDGWYIIKLIDGWTNPIMTETEWMKQRYDVERAIYKQKTDQLSDQYVHNLMLEEDPVIVRKTFDILRAFIGKNVLRPEKYSEWLEANYFGEVFKSMGRSEIEEKKSMVLVNNKSGNILLSDFIKWYEHRKPYLKFSTQSPQSFFGSVQQKIWIMIRDKLLIDRAYRRGLQNREIVELQRKWWKEKIIYSAVKADIAQSIKIEEDRLISYFNENKENYKNKNGEIIPFERAKSDVKNDLYQEEIISKMYHRIQRLKQKYNITINHEVLDGLYVDVENYPKAIEVYTVKTGGTLPRQAYPTIDWDWQTWY
ncbi:MAG: hypothetical protein IIA61_05710 [Candidatus Marinimicrobia bacterium]|nr:hypothetical protein [Candidatus Neomarinimicrobiota bacterium]